MTAEAAPGTLRSTGFSLPPNASRILAVALGIFAIVLPFLLEPTSTFLFQTGRALAFVIMALGLNIVVGFAGLLDLGYVAFYAIGSFTMGWFGSSFFADANVHVGVSGAANNLPGVHLNFLLVIIVAAVLCAIAGVLIGLPTLRLRGDYIAIVTLAFGEIIRVFAVNGESIHPFGKDYPLSAGRRGITPIDQVSIPPLSTFNQYINLRPYYWLALALVFVGLFIVTRLRSSRMGRAWIAIREDEVAAASMGVPLVKTKLLAYTVGGAFGGVSGAFLAPYLQTVNADQFAFNFSIFILAMVILGGLGSIWGVVLGAILVTYINYYLIPNVLNGIPNAVGLNFKVSDLGFGIFGFLLLIVMILRPAGLLPEGRRKLELEEGTGTDESVYEARA